MLSQKENDVLLDLCERIIDDGHELNIFSDESAIVYGLENNLLDCFLLNNMEEIRFGDSLVNLQQKYQQVLFMVLEKHSANTTSLRKHDELFQDLNQENIEYVSIELIVINLFPMFSKTRRSYTLQKVKCEF